MAPRFKKNMFWCWEEGGITLCLIGFSCKEDVAIFQFRDKLAELISSTQKLISYKQEGEPTRHDSIIRFFEGSDSESVLDFFGKKFPGFISATLKTKRYKDWNREWDLIMQLTKASLETSHDHPCILIDSVTHGPKELADDIKGVAKALSLELHEEPSLRPIDKVVMSNKTFEVLPKNWTGA